jgi:hypothetical protein
MKRRRVSAYYDPMIFARNVIFARNGSWLTRGIARFMRSKLRLLGLGIVFCFAVTAATQGYAQGHRELGSHYGTGHDRAAGREDRGGGASGQIAAWLFGIANFPVAFSILLKACGKAMSQTPDLKEAVGRINRKQKRYLMKLHYWLNPVAAGVAVIHLFSTECDAAAIPELGLGVMLLLCILGLMVTFRLSPAFMRKAVFRLHTSPIVLATAVAILLIGHSMID